MRGAEFQCQCGSVKMRMSARRVMQATHLVCYCKDCRAFANHLGKDDMLLDFGGTRILQTRPDHVEFVEGFEYLKVLRLGPNGLMRWYASCCDTPIGATLASGKIPFLGITAGTAANVDALGRVEGLGFTKEAIGAPADLKDRGLPNIMRKFIRRTIRGLIKGARRRNPFFKDGVPVVEPVVLTKEERDAATTL